MKEMIIVRESGASKTLIKSPGLSSDQYVIATHNERGQQKSIYEIQELIRRFIIFANTYCYKYRDIYFTVLPFTSVGLSEEGCARLFKKAVNVENIRLPPKYMEIITNTKDYHLCGSDIIRIKRLIARGTSLSIIAELFDVSYQTISNVKKRLNKEIKNDFTPEQIESLKEHITKKIQIIDSCWVWTGTVSDKGFGTVNVLLPNTQKRFQGTAANLTYTLFANNKLKKHTQLRSVCSNKLCVNPEHLTIITNRS